MLKRAQPLITLCVIALVAYALYLTFLVVPNERVMGPVQRIFYFHVGRAFAAYCSIAVVLVSSIAYLSTYKSSFDIVNHAAGEVGFLFCSIVLFTGMIWGYSAWNTPFRLEPRLISFLLLWLLFLGFNLLRVFGDEEKMGKHCAALGILGAITVPLVVYSIKLLPQFAQLHPQVVERGGLHDSSMKHTFLMASLAVIALQFLLVWFRARIGFIEQKRRLA
ncbi:MAG: cytochrome c biogenesis protein CcsA [Bdellovibrionales bacterium]|nr:cytochrome c biogenesis protein CcsA [Bdellovibrionales bacterium]